MGAFYQQKRGPQWGRVSVSCPLVQAA